MPLIEIQTIKKYGEGQRISLLKRMDKELTENLGLGESRFLINWRTFDSNSFLYMGLDAVEANEECPIIHIYSMEGKPKLIERTIMDTVLTTFSNELNIDHRGITIIFHPITSGNIYGSGNYLELERSD